METSIPYQEIELFKKEGICSVKSHFDSNYIAFLTKDDIFIHDSSLIDFPFVSNYQRDEESIQKYGQNHWIQWIDKENIAYGTCAGTIFHQKIDSEGQFLEPTVISIEKIIVSTFIAKNLLGICTSTSEIFLYDPQRKIKQKIQLPPEIGAIKNPMFQEPYTLYGLANNRPINFQIKPEIIQGKAPLQVTSINCPNISEICYHQNSTFAGCIKNDNSVHIALKGYEENSTVILKVEDSKSEIIGHTFLNNGTSYATFHRNGLLRIWNSITGSINNITINSIKDCTSFCLDKTNQQLILVSNEGVKSIQFITFKCEYGFTPRAVFNIFSNEKIFDISSDDTAKLFFPLSNAVVYKDVLLLCNKKGFATYRKNELSEVVQMEVLHSTIIMDTIVIVSYSKDMYGYYVAFFDFHCNELGWFPLSHAALTMHVCNNKIVLSANTKFSVIKLSNEPIDTKFITRKDEKIYINIKTTNVTNQIQDALATKRSKAVVFNVDGSVIIQTTKEQLATRCSRIWYVTKSDMLVIQKPCQYIVMFNGSLFPFNGSVLFSDGYCFYNFLPDIQFGKIILRKEVVISHLLIPTVDSDENFEMALEHFDGCPDLSTFLADTLLYSDQVKKFSLTLKRFCNLEDKLLQSQIFSKCLSKFENSQLDEFMMTIDVFAVFKNLSQPAQIVILNKSNPKLFCELVKQGIGYFQKPHEDFLAPVVNMLQKYEVSKAIRLIELFDLDIPKICEQVNFPAIKLESMLKYVYLDVNSFSEYSLPSVVNFICASLIGVNKQNFALSILLSTGNFRKASSILSINDDLLSEIKTIKISNDNLMKTIENTLSLI